MEKYEINGMRVSSTVIKDYLARGMIEEADKMLGRPFKITGRVTEGDGRGNSLGFPTANLICSKIRYCLLTEFIQPNAVQTVRCIRQCFISGRDRHTEAEKRG